MSKRVVNLCFFIMSFVFSVLLFIYLYVNYTSDLFLYYLRNTITILTFLSLLAFSLNRLSRFIKPIEVDVVEIDLLKIIIFNLMIISFISIVVSVYYLLFSLSDFTLVTLFLTLGQYIVLLVASYYCNFYVLNKNMLGKIKKVFKK